MRVTLPWFTSDYEKPSTLHRCTRWFSPTNAKHERFHTLDIAKRLIDYGFHPMTITFPMMCSGRDADRADGVSWQTGTRSVY